MVQTRPERLVPVVVRNRAAAVGLIDGRLEVVEAVEAACAAGAVAEQVTVELRQVGVIQVDDVQAVGLFDDVSDLL